MRTGTLSLLYEHQQQLLFSKQCLMNFRLQSKLCYSPFSCTFFVFFKGSHFARIFSLRGGNLSSRAGLFVLREILFCLQKNLSLNAKPIIVQTIFRTHQNFCKRYETSKIPSASFGGCKDFVRRENPLVFDIHPSLGHQISQHMDSEANVTE